MFTLHLLHLSVHIFGFRICAQRHQRYPIEEAVVVYSRYGRKRGVSSLLHRKPLAAYAHGADGLYFRIAFDPHTTHGRGRS